VFCRKKACGLSCRFGAVHNGYRIFLTDSLGLSVGFSKGLLLRASMLLGGKNFLASIQSAARRVRFHRPSPPPGFGQAQVRAPTGSWAVQQLSDKLKTPWRFDDIRMFARKQGNGFCPAVVYRPKRRRHFAIAPGQSRAPSINIRARTLLPARPVLAIKRWEVSQPPYSTTRPRGGLDG
jgi:hypothetical protein